MGDTTDVSAVLLRSQHVDFLSAVSTEESQRCRINYGVSLAVLVKFDGIYKSFSKILFDAFLVLIQKIYVGKYM